MLLELNVHHLISKTDSDETIDIRVLESEVILRFWYKGFDEKMERVIPHNDLAAGREWWKFLMIDYRTMTDRELIAWMDSVFEATKESRESAV